MSVKNILIVGLLVITIVIHVGLNGFAQRQAAQKQTKVSWEYKIVQSPFDINKPRSLSDEEKWLSQYGVEGWEVVMKEDRGPYLLKRAK